MRVATRYLALLARLTNGARALPCPLTSLLLMVPAWLTALPVAVSAGAEDFFDSTDPHQTCLRCLMAQPPSRLSGSRTISHVRPTDHRDSRGPQ